MIAFWNVRKMEERELKIKGNNIIITFPPFLTCLFKYWLRRNVNVIQ